MRSYCKRSFKIQAFLLSFLYFPSDSHTCLCYKMVSWFLLNLSPAVLHSIPISFFLLVLTRIKLRWLYIAFEYWMHGYIDCRHCFLLLHTIQSYVILASPQGKTSYFISSTCTGFDWLGTDHLFLLSVLLFVSCMVTAHIATCPCKVLKHHILYCLWDLLPVMRAHLCLWFYGPLGQCTDRFRLIVSHTHSGNETPLWLHWSSSYHFPGEFTCYPL